MNPVNQLNRITSSEFYTDKKGRLNDYLAYLNEIYDGSVFTTVKGQKGYSFINHEGDVLEFVPESGIYIVQCYDILELQLRQEVAEKTKEPNAISEVSLYVEKVIKRLYAISKKVETLQLATGLKKYKSEVIAKLQNCILDLESQYVINPIDGHNRQMDTQEVNNAKIKWKANKKVLAMLFYDLCNGSKISDKETTRYLDPVIASTDIQNIFQFIANNFVDAKGKPIKPETIQEYFKPAKMTKRKIILDYDPDIFKLY